MSMRNWGLGLAALLVACATPQAGNGPSNPTDAVARQAYATCDGAASTFQVLAAMAAQGQLSDQEVENANQIGEVIAPLCHQISQCVRSNTCASIDLRGTLQAIEDRYWVLVQMKQAHTLSKAPAKAPAPDYHSAHQQEI